MHTTVFTMFSKGWDTRIQHAFYSKNNMTLPGNVCGVSVEIRKIFLSELSAKCVHSERPRKSAGLAACEHVKVGVFTCLPLIRSNRPPLVDFSLNDISC